MTHIMITLFDNYKYSVEAVVYAHYKGDIDLAEASIMIKEYKEELINFLTYGYVNDVFNEHDMLKTCNRLNIIELAENECNFYLRQLEQI